jgi:hypothetical protein
VDGAAGRKRPSVDRQEIVPLLHADAGNRQGRRLVVGRRAAIDALDAEDGFRDARFGARVESFEGLELLSERGARGMKVYVRPTDALELGDATLDGVTYGFYHGELYFVAIFTSGSRNALAALAQLQKVYGPGARVSQDTSEYVWRGRKVVLHYRADAVTGMSMIGFTSLPIDARVQAAQPVVPAAIAP